MIVNSDVTLAASGTRRAAPARTISDGNPEKVPVGAQLVTVATSSLSADNERSEERLTLSTVLVVFFEHSFQLVCGPI